MDGWGGLGSDPAEGEPLPRGASGMSRAPWSWRHSRMKGWGEAGPGEGQEKGYKGPPGPSPGWS